ncbi:MAG: rhomboid family intramembrane serine protease [Bacteroidetes bacterium]|nr:MAG: rhomboid family intramembrane serine protease [Bacteroidota bacterium]PIE87685.1 MAG: rhomboid family intramembrane serine protease [Bacteroidota bacterium]
MYSQLFQQWLQDIRQFFLSKSLLSRLILINIAVWFTLFMINQLLWLFKAEGISYEIIRYLAVPADKATLLRRPWTLFSYMFTHEKFWHLFFNMYILYFGGTLFMQHLTKRHLLNIYLYGGLAGAFLYIFSFNFFPVFETHIQGSIALGASASVLGVVIAIATYRPNLPINIVFFGQVKMKYLALVFILLDLISITGSNSGGHLAHLGGAMAGWLYILLVFRNRSQHHGKRIKIPLLRSLFPLKKKKKPTSQKQRPFSDEAYNLRKKKQQQEIDKILDKISQSGYDSLSSKEKETLFKQSNKKEGH